MGIAWTLILHKKSEASGVMRYDTLPSLEYPCVIVYNPCLVICKGLIFVHDTRLCLLRMAKDKWWNCKGLYVDLI